MLPYLFNYSYLSIPIFTYFSRSFIQFIHPYFHLSKRPYLSYLFTFIHPYFHLIYLFTHIHPSLFTPIFHVVSPGLSKPILTYPNVPIYPIYSSLSIPLFTYSNVPIYLIYSYLSIPIFIYLSKPIHVFASFIYPIRKVMKLILLKVAGDPRMSLDFFLYLYL